MNKWLNKAEYPFSANYFIVNGQKLHYIDEGQGYTILFVHGTPSWSYDMRNVIKNLSKYYRCVAIDHIGFGLSEKPANYDYSTMNHSNTLEKFVIELGLKNFTLVVHDFGGPIGMNMAINNPERVSRFVILNSWLWSCKNDPGYIKLARVLKSPILPFLYKYLNFSPRFILPQSFGDNKIGRSVLSQYTRPFADKTQRNGTLAFARSLLNDQEWFEELWQKRQKISGKPTLFIWGTKDSFITPSYLEKYASGFQNATTNKIETSGHFPQEEKPDLVSELMRKWMEKTDTSI